MQEYKTLQFSDTNIGRRRFEETLNQLANRGWKLLSKQTVSQGWSGPKTFLLGSIALPLALLGRKDNVIEAVFERTKTKQTAKWDEEDRLTEQSRLHQTQESNKVFQVIGYIFLGIIALFAVFLLIKNSLSSVNSVTLSSHKQIGTTQKQDPVTKYKTRVSGLIKQYEDQIAIIDKHPPTTAEYDYLGDPVYVHADDVFESINTSIPRFTDDIPSQYQSYDQFLIDIVRTTLIAVDDLVHPANYSHSLPHVSDDIAALAQVRKDIVVAEQIDPTKTTFYSSEGEILSNLYDTINTADFYK